MKNGIKEALRRRDAREGDDDGIEIFDDDEDDRPKRRWWKKDDEDPGEKPVQHEWTGASAAMTRAATIGLRLLMLAGPVALLLWWIQPSQVVWMSNPNTDDAGNPGQEAAVSAFAEDYVATWLTTAEGDEAALEPFIESGSDITLPSQPWTVADAATADVASEGDDVWSVTVAISVQERERGAPIRRYFQTAVLNADGALRAQTFPAQVAAPPAAVPAQMNYRYSLALDHPLAESSSSFLSALLTGTGDAARYTTPGTTIEPIDPAPYTAITVSSIQADTDLGSNEVAPENGAQVQVLATITARAGRTRALTLQYALTLKARDGRWEVESLDSTPELVGPPEGEASTDASTDSSTEPTTP